MKKTQEEVRITLRLPVEVHATLVKSAQDHNRSLNGEIVYQLKQKKGK